MFVMLEMPTVTVTNMTVDSWWSDWSVCSKACGSGHRHRSRVCASAYYSPDDTYCPQPFDDIQSCNNNITNCRGKHGPLLLMIIM